ncbi:DUF551 domain-containing protein [Cronobacter sakazakii]|nr:DUF551 domain-containing protein [Cronobacter sakazakii]
MNTISNERLEELANGDMEVWYSESQSMARELLALRKERERAEPVPQLENLEHFIAFWRKVQSGAMSPSKNEINYTVWFLEKLADIAAPPAPGADDDSLPYDPQIAEYEQMMEAEQAQADTTAQQFESLAGKVVGRSDGFECTPVADLYELLTKCGECYDYTTSAKVAADWIKEGYSAREYVKLDRLQEAMTQGSSGEADSWIPCSERMPDFYYSCLAADEHGDMVIGLPSNLEVSDRKAFCLSNGELFLATHWQPLPEPPCK